MKKIILKNLNLTGISIDMQISKLKEEIRELDEAIQEGNKTHIIEEMWDIIQVELGYIHKKANITADTIMNYYNDIFIYEKKNIISNKTAIDKLLNDINSLNEKNICLSFWESVQANISYVMNNNINLLDIVNGYNNHLQKIKNRPRYKIDKIKFNKEKELLNVE